MSLGLWRKEAKVVEWEDVEDTGKKEGLMIVKMGRDDECWGGLDADKMEAIRGEAVGKTKKAIIISLRDDYCGHNYNPQSAKKKRWKWKLETKSRMEWKEMVVVILKKN